MIHIRSQVKTRQSQSYIFETLHTTHLLKLLDKKYIYELDPTKTVGAKERTLDVGRMDGRTDGRTEWNQYTPRQLCCVGVWLKPVPNKLNDHPQHSAHLTVLGHPWLWWYTYLLFNLGWALLRVSEFEFKFIVIPHAHNTSIKQIRYSVKQKQTSKA